MNNIQTDNKETIKFELEKPVLKKELPEDVIRYLKETYPPRINGAGIEQHDNVNYITEELSFLDDVNVNNCIMTYGVAPLGVLWFLRLRMANTLGWGIDVTGKEYQRLLNDMTLDLNMTYDDFQYLSDALIKSGIVKVVNGSDGHVYWTTMQQFYNFEYKSWTRLKNNAAARKYYESKMLQLKSLENKENAEVLPTNEGKEEELPTNIDDEDENSFF